MCQTSPNTTNEDGPDSGKLFHNMVPHNAVSLTILKAQYEFIHYALSELVVCGETEIVAANLRSFTDSLRDSAEGSGPTISQQHMTVCFRLFLISDGFVLLD